MSNPSPSFTFLGLGLPRFWLPWLGMAGAGLLGIAVGWLLLDGNAAVVLASIGLTLVLAPMLRLAWGGWGALRRRWIFAQLQQLVEGDINACIATNGRGEVRFANAAGTRRLAGATTLTSLLEGMFAHPGAVLYRMQNSAASGRPTREDLATHQGSFRLSVHCPAADLYLWRLEELAERGLPGHGPDGISLPMLISNEGGTVLFANAALRRLLGTRPRRVDRVILDQPYFSGSEVSIAGTTGLVRAQVLEITGGAERRETYLLPAGSLAGAAAPAPAVPVEDALEDLPVALLRLGRDGQIQSANREARDIFGLAQDGEMRNLSDLVEGLGRSVRDWVGDIAAGRLPGRPEILRLRATSREEAFVQIAVRRMGSRGQAGLIAVISDATAMKTLEAQFVQSQKMHAIGQFAGGISHDFNNLLTAISGHCDLLLLRKTASDTDYDDLSQIRQNANRAAGLVRQLLAFSRKQTLMAEVVRLDEVLGEVTHLLRRLVGEHVRLTFVTGEETGAIRTDRRQLEQVLVNLVVNARDAMPRGGEITIVTERCRLAAELRIGRAVVPAGDYALITVSDTGTGISAEHLGQIFEPFFTTKRPGEGTGLGLSTVYGIVKQSGGYIFVDSIEGSGTEFRLYFPRHNEVAAAEAPPPRPPPLRAGAGVVLLVEDEAPVRAFAARALRLRGYTVVEAEHAEAALELLADPALQVDIFVTDVVMPGLDGPDWVCEALKTRPDTRVIFVSGYAEESFADRQAEIPQSVFLPKPFSLEELTRTVQAQLG